MKKIGNFLKKAGKWVIGILAGGLVLGILLIGISAILSIGQKSMDKVTSQAYAEGQYDGIHGTVNYKVLISESDAETDKAKKSAYAQGHDDAVTGDVRIKAVTDSTFIWIKSPWDDKKIIPTDTIKIVRKKK